MRTRVLLWRRPASTTGADGDGSGTMMMPWAGGGAATGGAGGGRATRAW